MSGGSPSPSRWSVLLLVAHMISDESGDDELPTEVIGIISARKADRKERLRYEQQYG